MKNIKILFALLAIVFIAASAFTAQQNRNNDEQFFVLNGDPAERLDWDRIDENIPEVCTAPVGDPCLIFTLEAGGAEVGHPAYTEFNALLSASEGFTEIESIDEGDVYVFGE